MYTTNFDTKVLEAESRKFIENSKYVPSPQSVTASGFSVSAELVHKTRDYPEVH